MADIDPATPVYPQPSDRIQAAGSNAKSHLWEESEVSFGDLVDAINPLQHIPVVATVYRYLTGDQIGNVARVVGDGLYGGPIGAAAGLASVALKEETGRDPGEHVIAMLTGEDAPAAASDNVAVAGAAQPAAAVDPVRVPLTSAPLPAPATVTVAAQEPGPAPVQLAANAAPTRLIHLAAAASIPAPAAAATAPVPAGPAPTTPQAASAPKPAAAPPQAIPPGASAPQATPPDPTAVFHAENAAFMQRFGQNQAANGPHPVLNNRPIPLQGFALATVGTGVYHPMTTHLAALPPNPGTTVPSAADLALAAAPPEPPAPRSGGISTGLAPPGIGNANVNAPGINTPGTNGPGFNASGITPAAPVVIQQQMMDALDKYARMQQVRDASRGKDSDSQR